MLYGKTESQAIRLQGETKGFYMGYAHKLPRSQHTQTLHTVRCWSPTVDSPNTHRLLSFTGSLEPITPKQSSIAQEEAIMKQPW